MNTESEMYVDMIIQTKEWFDKKKNELATVSKGDAKISFKGNDGDTVELPDHMKKGFLFGIKTALEIFGEFPISISKSDDDDNDEEI
jgi:hypothetical protein